MVADAVPLWKTSGTDLQKMVPLEVNMVQILVDAAQKTVIPQLIVSRALERMIYLKASIVLMSLGEEKTTFPGVNMRVHLLLLDEKVEVVFL
jgi:hypothetical protein